jgi:hypothetical protein
VQQNKKIKKEHNKNNSNTIALFLNFWSFHYPILFCIC